MRRFVILMTVALFSASLAAGSQVYRWVDEDGNVHYSDRPPPGNAERVQIDRGAITFETLEDEDAEADNDGQMAEDFLARQCQLARDQLAEYEDADVLYRAGEDGDEELSEEEAALEIAELRGWINGNC
jgi:hypothetical protein